MIQVRGTKVSNYVFEKMKQVISLSWALMAKTGDQGAKFFLHNKHKSPVSRTIASLKGGNIYEAAIFQLWDNLC